MSALGYPTEVPTIADLIRSLGGISPDRILAVPPPGTATVADATENERCELIDGTLVRKVLGFQKSLVAVSVVMALGKFVDEHDLGQISGPTGLEILPNLVRIPDVAYYSWERFPSGKLPKESIPKLVPDLAVEVIERANTPAEMQRKRREYFRSGVHAVWIVDRFASAVTVFTSPEESQTLAKSDILDGIEFLPGFSVPVKDFFGQLQPRRGRQ